MRGAVQGRDTSVRGITSKGRFVQGAQHPRTFGQGHIGRGQINPASGLVTVFVLAVRRSQSHHLARSHPEPEFVNDEGAQESIPSKESIPPAYEAWRAGTSIRVVVLARNRFLGSLKGLQIRA
jgi:hypothetical protein